MVGPKIWVQPVRDLWEIKYNGKVEYRTRTREQGLEEALLIAQTVMKKNKENVEVVIEETSGKLSSQYVMYEEKD